MNVKRTAFVIGLVVVLTLLWGLQVGQVMGQAPAEGVSASTVLLIAADEGRGGRLIPKWSGSGTLISSDGLILTNCQVAFPKVLWDDPQFEYDVLIVALATEADKPPQPLYIAEVAQYDAALDLAVVRISQTLNGVSVDPRKLRLPAVSLGDSDKVAAGDALSIWGYSGVAGQAAESVEVKVSGFSSGRGIKGRAWIKVDTELEGALSGGAAVNEEDELVGILAAGAAGSADDIMHCRYTDDTNGDGTVDLNDTCTATGGTISTLRPANLAEALIRAAGQNLGPQPTPVPLPTRTPVPLPTRTPGAPRPTVSRLIFAPDIDEYDQPVTVVESFPSGTETIYFFFDYANFADGASWQPVLVYEGEPVEDAWPVEKWEGGPQGVWWLSFSGDPELADGSYEFVITYEGKELGSATVEVGGPEEKAPAFANIVFSGGGEEGYLLPGGIKEIVATFDYANMSRDTKWSYIGYYQGKEIAKGEGKPFSRASGTTSLPLSSTKALDPGIYRLELYIGERLAATADCRVQEDLGKVFGPITFAEGEDRDGNPLKPSTTFKSGISAVYAFFDWQGMQDGWTWSRAWYLDGEYVTGGESAWESGESGKNFWIYIYTKQGSLPEGRYRLDLRVEGELVQSGFFEIVGKTPSPRPTITPVPPKAGVVIYGRITDADTGRGIQGALFIVLQPGVSVQDFIVSGGDESLVYTWTETDRKGDYQLPNPLVRGESYSIIITADGYRPLTWEDGEVPEDMESPYEWNITLERM